MFQNITALQSQVMLRRGPGRKTEYCSASGVGKGSMECRGRQPQMDSGGVTESTRLTEQVKTQEKKQASVQEKVNIHESSLTTKLNKVLSREK